MGFSYFQLPMTVYTVLFTPSEQRLDLLREHIARKPSWLPRCIPFLSKQGLRQSCGSISFVAVILVHSTAYNDVTHLLNVSRLMLLSICFRIQIHIIDPSGTL